MLTLVLLSQSLWCSGESIRLPGHDSTLRRDHVNLGRLVTRLRASVAAALGCAGSALVTLHRFTHRVLPLHCRQALHEPPSPRPSTLPPAHVSILVKVKGDDQHKALSRALGPQQTYSLRFNFHVSSNEGSPGAFQAGLAERVEGRFRRRRAGRALAERRGAQWWQEPVFSPSRAGIQQHNLR